MQREPGHFCESLPKAEAHHLFVVNVLFEPGLIPIKNWKGWRGVSQVLGDQGHPGRGSFQGRLHGYLLFQRPTDQLTAQVAEEWLGFLEVVPTSRSVPFFKELGRSLSAEMNPAFRVGCVVMTRKDLEIDFVGEAFDERDHFEVYMKAHGQATIRPCLQSTESPLCVGSVEFEPGEFLFPGCGIHTLGLERVEVAACFRVTAYLEQVWGWLWVKGAGMAGDTQTCNHEEMVKVLEQMPDGIMVLDNQSAVLYANKTGARLVKMKPKTVVGSTFQHDIEDGPMRDFDVEMTVKDITWGGEPARLLHLKSLKNSGAFHLEWKLESALERAREAEDALAELRQQAEQTASSPADSEAAPSSSEQVSRLEERVAELENLLELAEERADKLLDDIHLDDHQQATALQDALTQARDAEEQMRRLEEDLADTRERVRVAEEQAEVAEERAYSLEAEVEQMLADAEERAEAEQAVSEPEDSGRIEELEGQVAQLQEQVSSLAANLVEQKAQNSTLAEELERALAEVQSGLSQEDSEALNTRIAELEELLEQAADSEELQRSQQQIEAGLEELEVVQRELGERDERISELETQLSEAQAARADLDAAEAQTTELVEQLQAKNSELTEKFSELEQQLKQQAEELEAKATRLAEKEEELAAKDAELVSKDSELEEHVERAKIALEESEELAEHMRIEQEQYEADKREFEQQIEELTADLEAAEGERDSLLTELEDAARTTEERSTEAEQLAVRVAGLEEVTSEVESLKKTIRRLETQLEDAEELAQKGEKVEKLERKLEGALRRAEEAEERLDEERRLLNEHKQRVEELSAQVSQVPSLMEAGADETERLAFQDAQTGLPNRNIIQRYLDFMLKRSAGNQQFTAMLRIDCDNFKTISDTFGVETGDQLIRVVGERLSSVIDGSNVLGRYGEDEFIILLSEMPNQDAASHNIATVIKKIYQRFRQPVPIGEQSITLSVSLGVSVYPVDARNGEQMFEHSGVALKRAKENGRGQAQYFTTELQTAHVARNELDKELKRGLENGELEVLYQPIFDLVNGQIVGVESLVRWKHPVRGVLSPGDFLEVAEDSGIMVLIGNWATRTALEHAVQWHQRGLGIFVSINLSQRQLLQADLLPTIQSLLTEIRCSPDRLLLEIPERLSGPDYPKVREALLELQKVGVRMAVDNFGTGSTSLQDLRRGPFQVIKVDREFIRGVHQNDENKSIVMSALTMGHHLGRLSVAVGVESEMEKDWLVKTGCRFAQGNFLSEPLTAAQISDLCKRT